MIFLKLSKSDHVTPLLKILQCLPWCLVEQRPEWLSRSFTVWPPVSLCGSHFSLPWALFPAWNQNPSHTLWALQQLFPPPHVTFFHTAPWLALFPSSSLCSNVTFSKRLIWITLLKIGNCCLPTFKHPLTWFYFSVFFFPSFLFTVYINFQNTMKFTFIVFILCFPRQKCKFLKTDLCFIL